MSNKQNSFPLRCVFFSADKNQKYSDNRSVRNCFLFHVVVFPSVRKKKSVMFLLFLFVKPRHTSPSIFGLCYKCAVQQKPRRLVINLNHKNSIIYSSQEESLWRRGRVNAKAPFFYYSLLCSTSLTFIFSDFSI